MKTLRLFTAITLSDETRSVLSGILQKASVLPSVKWVEPSQLHVTLRFLGEQDEALVPRMKTALQSVAETAKSFEIELGGLGAFPDLESPKVLFVPVVGGQDSLNELFENVSNALEGAGVSTHDKNFHAHVTLGRVKVLEGMGEVVHALQEMCPPSLGKNPVKRFSLFRSALARSGPIHTELEKFNFPG